MLIEVFATAHEEARRMRLGESKLDGFYEVPALPVEGAVVTFAGHRFRVMTVHMRMMEREQPRTMREPFNWSSEIAAYVWLESDGS